jgi:Flp pilus assembly protein TadD
VARAERAFHTAQRLRPWDVTIAETAGHAHAVLALTDPDPHAALAQAWLAHAATRLPDSAPVAADQATAADAAGDLPAALAHWNRALALDPNNPDYLLGRGITHARAGDYPAAEADFQAAASIVPNSPAPRDNLTQLRHLQQDQTSAPRP